MRKLNENQTLNVIAFLGLAAIIITAVVGLKNSTENTLRQTNMYELNMKVYEQSEEIKTLQTKINEQQEEIISLKEENKELKERLAYAILPEIEEFGTLAIEEPVQVARDIDPLVIEKSPISDFTRDEFNNLCNRVCEWQNCDMFKNHGEYFFNCEKEYDIDGILIMAILCNESGFGSNCINTNNASGMRLNSGAWREFDTPGDCINHLGNLLSTKYRNMGLITIEEIGSIYCEDPEFWAATVSDIYSDIEALV